MQLPLTDIAPIVREHGIYFHNLFQNKAQIRHFDNYLTGLITLENKTMSNITRCILESADKTNLSRFFTDAKWRAEEVNTDRLKYMLEQTEGQRRKSKDSVLPIDDTLCEHVGNLFEYVDQHYNHTDKTFPTAHNLVTSHYVSGAVRFPVDYRLYRRYEEFTQWETYVAMHFPNEVIPKKKKERTRFRKRVEPTLLNDPAFLALHQAFQTKIILAVELVEHAIANQIPFDTVLFDSWFLARELVAVLKKHNKHWISIIKSNRNVLTSSFTLKDAAGQPIQFEKPKMQLKELVPLIPPSAFQPLVVDGTTYYCFTKNLFLPSLGKVRLVISFDNPECQGNFVALVTNHLSWNAKKIIATYLLRWPIETFYQDCKQLLGLDDYRMRRAPAIGKHWSLVFVAYSFLHLASLPNSQCKNTQSPSKSIGQVVRQQQQAAIEQLILHAHRLLQAGQQASKVFETLFMKQSPFPIPNGSCLS
jgi:SRSO17 transposase